MDIPVTAEAATAPAGRLARWLAPAIVVVVLGMDVAAYFAHRGQDDAVALGALILIETLTAATVGLLIVRRHPRHAVGWLLLAHAVSVAVVLSGESYAFGSPRVQAWTNQLAQGTWVLLYVFLALIGYVFPNGRFLTGRWRGFVIACLAGYGVFLVAAAFDVESFRAAFPGLEPPLPALPGPIAAVLGIVGLIAIVASLIGAVVAARARLRRSVGDERVQMLWFAWAALAVPAGIAVCWLDYWLTGRAETLTVIGVTVAGSVIPLAIGVAILRHRLFDIELVLSRTLTYGALTVLVVGTYAGVLTAFGTLIDNRSAGGLVGVGLVAVAIQPVHARLRRRVERWVYGAQADPYVALRRLSDRLDETLEDLQRSRARLVTAQEEERRRLRRDLHDGLGPSLAAIVLKLNAVSTMVRDPAAKDLLAELREETKAAIAEIRRLVDDLRPPALDEVGLVAALRQRAAALSTSGQRPLIVDVDGPGGTPPLPAAVEVAAYRIATEALTNVVRHSGASRCLITVTMNGALEVSVADNGAGPGDGNGQGVGWTSMRERAAELGGSCTIIRRPEGGTLVRAVLPLADVLSASPAEMGERGRA